MNPILLDFPNEFYTERLHIRMPMHGDGQAMYESIEASKKEISPWLPFARQEQTVEEVEINIREAHIKFLKREDLRLLVFEKETGELVASSGLHQIDWTVPKFEIGYWIDTRHGGKGYITEAVKGIADFAFTQLKARRVQIRCDPKNKRSSAVAERAGFTLEGILKNDERSLDGDSLTDTCVYAMTK
ncbi:GNAT family N-acetyltransferase [Bacillus sp. JCM 19041]|uniref:GNAT family N-acetyltransferase n=1 Tax=Bacillus sp. JCM 19041 TaxID=1460637 RepID=UPI0006D10EE5